MVPRGMRRYVACHTSCIPARAYFTLKLLLSYPQVILYFLVATSSMPVTSAWIPSDGLHTYVRAWEYWGVPKASSGVASRSSGHHGYIRNLGRSLYGLIIPTSYLRKFLLLLLFLYLSLVSGTEVGEGLYHCHFNSSTLLLEKLLTQRTRILTVTKGHMIFAFIENNYAFTLSFTKKDFSFFLSFFMLDFLINALSLLPCYTVTFHTFWK